MDIYLYNTPTDTEHCIKELLNESHLTGQVKGEASEDFMEFDLYGSYKDENYCYIPEFRRYYWITERNMYRNNITTLTLKSDPFMSFFHSAESVTGIEDLDIYVTRANVAGRDGSENPLEIGFNAYLRDDGVAVIEKTRFQLMLDGGDTQIHFDFDDEIYYLVTVG